MKQLFKISVLLLTCTLLLSLCPVSKKNTEEKDAKEIVNKLITSVGKLETMKWNLKVIERIKGKEKKYGSSVKLKLHPRKLYINIKGVEVLWLQGTNNGKAYVNPNAFPYVNLNLDPMGSLMRKEQHHTINEMGFTYLTDIIHQIVLKAGDKFPTYFKYAGEEEHNYQKCYKINVTNPDFAYVNYKVLKGENLITIARKLYVGEYMILENNPSLDGFNDVNEGDIIKVPTSYAKNVTIYVDALYYVPVGVVVYDDKGLYEQYDYFFLQVNPKIADEEFTKDYKDYKF
ncbi:MAG: DUF1571 domain-containing protein [Bacteroidia bacterium]|nr:DUF1571 domain-containing protein [Bacteroidia bacterium]